MNYLKCCASGKSFYSGIAFRKCIKLCRPELRDILCHLLFSSRSEFRSVAFKKKKVNIAPVKPNGFLLLVAITDSELLTPLEEYK